MKCRIILPIVLAMLTASGCDFVRTIAGRPTEAQIESIRLERIRQEEARHQARLDSMQRVRRQMADSLAAREAYLQDSLSHARGALMGVDRLGGVKGTALTNKYCIVVGAFRNPDYAMRKANSCSEAGYQATIVEFRNGLNAVTLCPSDDIEQILRDINKLRAKGLCTAEGWILLNQ